MKKHLILFFILSVVAMISCKGPEKAPDDFWKLANDRKQNLRLSTYVTAHTVEQMFITEEGPLTGLTGKTSRPRITCFIFRKYGKAQHESQIKYLDYS